jgi:hypothetical protein
MYLKSLIFSQKLLLSNVEYIYIYGKDKTKETHVGPLSWQQKETAPKKRHDFSSRIIAENHARLLSIPETSPILYKE